MKKGVNWVEALGVVHRLHNTWELFDPSPRGPFEWHQKALFDPACHESIGLFDLAVGLRVRHGCIVERNVLLFAEILELFSREVCAIISDDTVWDTKAVDYALYEVNCRSGSRICDGDRLDPLCELVDCYQEVSMPAMR